MILHLPADVYAAFKVQAARRGIRVHTLIKAVLSAHANKHWIGVEEERPRLELVRDGFTPLCR